MFSEKGISELKLRFETQGFVHLRRVIPDDVMLRAREAFDMAAGDRLPR
jgi:hypothetical protein